MAVRETLNPDQVDALFSGRHEALYGPESDATAGRPYSPKYDRCDACGFLGPLLMTFRGRLDWEPTIPADDPIRGAIAALRDEHGHRTILLCGPCITTLRAVPKVSPPPDGRLPIAWN